MSILPKRFFPKTNTLDNGDAISSCPVGVVRDVCGPNWRLLSDSEGGWKLLSANGEHCAFVKKQGADWTVRWPRDKEQRISAEYVLKSLVFAGMVSKDSGSIEMDGPSHFRFLAAQNRRK